MLKPVKSIPGCWNCPMMKLFPENPFVSPRLVAGNRIMIAEAPGAEEAQEGEPLVGGSGRILRGLRVKDVKTGEYKRYGGLIGEAGLKDREISYINVIQCRPPDNVFPTDPKAKEYISKEEGEKAVKQCLQRHVLPILRSRTWRRIDLIGGKALKYLGEKQEGVEAWRGSPIIIPALGDNKAIAMATIHPAALMRDQRFMVAVVNDLTKSLVQPPEYYTLHPSLEQCRAFVEAAANADHLTLDIETNYPQKPPRITIVGLSYRPYYVTVFPFAGAFKDLIRRALLQAKKLVGQNLISFDLPMLFKELDIEWKN